MKGRGGKANVEDSSSEIVPASLQRMRELAESLKARYLSSITFQTVVVRLKIFSSEHAQRRRYRGLSARNLCV